MWGINTRTALARHPPSPQLAHRPSRQASLSALLPAPTPPHGDVCLCTHARHPPARITPAPSSQLTLQVRAATLSAVTIQLQQRPAPQGVDPNMMPPEELLQQLPPMEPYSFVPEELAANCNMVELAVTGACRLQRVPTSGDITCQLTHVAFFIPC